MQLPKHFRGKLAAEERSLVIRPAFLGRYYFFCKGPPQKRLYSFWVHFWVGEGLKDSIAFAARYHPTGISQRHQISRRPAILESAFHSIFYEMTKWSVES